MRFVQLLVCVFVAIVGTLVAPAARGGSIGLESRPGEAVKGGPVTAPATQPALGVGAGLGLDLNLPPAVDLQQGGAAIPLLPGVSGEAFPATFVTPGTPLAAPVIVAPATTTRPSSAPTSRPAVVRP